MTRNWLGYPLQPSPPWHYYIFKRESFSHPVLPEKGIKPRPVNHSRSPSQCCPLASAALPKPTQRRPMQCRNKTPRGSIQDSLPQLSKLHRKEPPYSQTSPLHSINIHHYYLTPSLPFPCLLQSINFPPRSPPRMQLAGQSPRVPQPGTLNRDLGSRKLSLRRAEAQR